MSRAFRVLFPLWVVMAATLCWVGAAVAQSGTTVGGLSAEFVVGAILTVGIAGVGAYSKRIDNAQNQLRSDFLQVTREDRQAMNSRINLLESAMADRYDALDKEDRQLQSQLTMMRELVFKEYPDRKEYDRHHERLERSLEHIHDRLNQIGAPMLRRRTDLGPE